MAYANTFKRREMKFLLDEAEYSKMINAISELMTADEYGIHTLLKATPHN